MDRCQIITIIIGLPILFLCTVGCEQKPIEKLALGKIGGSILPSAGETMLAALPPAWINNPEVIIIYLISTIGHVSSSPFYLHTKEGEIFWNPFNEDAGVYQIKITVTNGVHSQEEVVTITVNGVNYPPYVITRYEKSIVSQKI